MKGKPGGILNGFLDKGARIEGTLTFDDMFRIDGQFKGTVLSDHELVVGEGGTVEGEIRVGRLSASGIVRGTVHAKERIEIHRGAPLPDPGGRRGGRRPGPGGDGATRRGKTGRSGPEIINRSFVTIDPIAALWHKPRAAAFPILIRNLDFSSPPPPRARHVKASGKSDATA